MFQGSLSYRMRSSQNDRQTDSQNLSWLHSSDLEVNLDTWVPLSVCLSVCLSSPLPSLCSSLPLPPPLPFCGHTMAWVMLGNYCITESNPQSYICFLEYMTQKHILCLLHCCISVPTKGWPLWILGLFSLIHRYLLISRRILRRDSVCVSWMNEILKSIKKKEAHREWPLDHIE